VQAEALDPAALARIVREAIEDLLDLHQLARVIAVEETERVELVAAAEELGR